ncbi:MAG TPA: hypothetical protein PKL96_07090 [Bacteroidales bacterium]|nr:hypothetical protein [Bacteroidales bacterium]HPS26090.1 hypothetical protein [Bacteroidales bacterium]
MSKPVNSKQSDTKLKSTKWIIAVLIILPMLYLVYWNYFIRNKDLSAPVHDSANVDNNTAFSPAEKLQSAIDLAKARPSESNYINLSMEYYNNNMFKECIQASQKALELNPQNATAYNNICSAYNAMKMYDKGAEACEKALKIDPDFQLAKNNLAWAKSNQ